MVEKRKITRTIKLSCPTWYDGNLFILVLFLILWPPVGILLLLKNGCLSRNHSRFYLNYYGRWGWLIFWGFFFFPISILLLFFKGVDVIEEETIGEETIIDQPS